MKKIVQLLMLFTLLSVSALTAYAADDDNTLRLSATGEVNIEPDMAFVSVAVTTEAKSAQAAVKDNALKMDSVVKALKSKIGDKDTLQTGMFQMNPVYFTDRETRQSSITGYRVTNQINIEYHDLESLGDLLDVVVGQGINQIQQLQFSHTQMNTFGEEALKNAIQNGKALAKLAALEAGVEIEGIKDLTLIDNRQGPVYREMAMAMDSGAPKTAIIPGQLTVSRTVNMVFKIDN